MSEQFDIVNISYKTLNVFEEIYNREINKVIENIKNNIKEKYNIDINTDGTNKPSNNNITSNN